MVFHYLWLLLVSGAHCFPATPLKSETHVLPHIADAPAQQVPGEAGYMSEHVLLLQTSLQLAPVKPVRPKAASLLHANSTVRKQRIGTTELWNKVFRLGKDECLPTWPLQTELMFSILRHVEDLPPRKVCQDAVWRVVSLNASADAHRQVNHRVSQVMSSTMWVLAAYWIVIVVTIICMLRTLRSSPNLEQLPETGRRAELDAWNYSILSWVSISWATPWIQRWGHDVSDRVKIKASELGQIGDAEDECRNAIKKFAKLWAEQSDISSKGAMLRTLFYFAGARKIVVVLFAGFVCESLMYIGPVITVWWILNTANSYYQLRAAGVEISSEEYLPTVVGVLLMFTIIPFVTSCFNTSVNLMCARLNLRMQAALATAVYLKGLRLPAGLKELDLTDGVPRPTHEYSIVSLVSTDVNVCLVEFVNSALVLITTTPILMILLMLLLVRLKAAIIFAFAALAVVITFWLFSCVCLITSLNKCQYASGTRIALFQEIILGIRVVKAYAWEDVAKQRIMAIREEEMKHLAQYWRWLGVSIASVLAAPKCAILAALFGYNYFYKAMGPIDIFVFIQILNALQATAAMWSSSIPLLVAVGPALRRIEMFLKTEEADAPGLKESQFMPGWVETWPRELEPGTKIPELQLKGSFSWLRGKDPVLHEIDFCIAKGERVAIIGEVGSGKTTLLQALCGDLYPGGEALLSIPNKIAYHAQVPCIIEGTLKENVLFYQPCDDNQYHIALSASCLLTELEVWPGGDNVPIGSRGISLSGGQKAKVSMARIAYAQNANLVLLDDPFASLDSQTANQIIERMLQGVIFEGRTVVCVLQPHADTLKNFDRVFVMRGGRIEAGGPPSQILNSDAVKRLMTQSATKVASPSSFGQDRVEATNFMPKCPASNSSSDAALQFREEEAEGRFDYPTLKFFVMLGGWKRLLICFLFYVLSIFCHLFAEITLARWSNEVMFETAVIAMDLENLEDYSFIPAWRFQCRALLWLFLACALFAWSWYSSTQFTITISDVLHRRIFNNLLSAPIDYFYDKTPVARILNRMSSDLANLDQRMFTQVTSTTAQCCWIFVIVVYTILVLPLVYSFVCPPIWFAIVLTFRKYINVVVPLRYLTNVCRSEVNAHISEVDRSKTALRAFQVLEQVVAEQCAVMDNLIKAQFACHCVKRWLLNRLRFLWAVWATVIAVFAIFSLDVVSVGAMSVCLTSAMLSFMNLDSMLDMMTNMQFEYVCMNRLYEYLDIQQERPSELRSDRHFKNWTALCPRIFLCCGGKLEIRECKNGVQVWWTNGQHEQLLVEQVPDDEALRIPSEAALQKLQKIPGLECMQISHRIIAVNDAYKNSRLLAEEYVDGLSNQVLLRIESAWLEGGAHLQIADLVAGYADSPFNVLKGINITIEPRAKAAIVGKSGAGKSTLILCLLRVTEPRGGRVLINNVDTKDIGLKALRTSLGLVPNDPLIFSGCIRTNLDPLGEFMDNRIWKALHAVQISDFIDKFGEGLEYMCASDGSNLSLGQRQLICMARMIVRQPSLLLLDDCTSSIDPRMQEVVQEAVYNCFPDSTLLVVAHRLETVLDFDTIIVLENGRVVEKGSPKALVKQTGGVFAGMLTAR